MRLFQWIFQSLAPPEREDEEQEQGQGMVEYALIISFVAMIVIGSLFVFGPRIGNFLNYASNSLNH